jgi:hypothetical protein
MLFWCICCADDAIDAQLVRDVEAQMLAVRECFPSPLLAAVIESRGEVL